MRSARLIPFFLVALLSLPCSARAQTRSHGPILLELPGSTRAMSMGNTFPLVRMGADALFHNPALLQSASGIVGSAQRYGPGTTLISLAGVAEWMGGAWGLGVRQLTYGAAAETPSSLSADSGSLFRNGAVGASEMVATLGYSRTLFGVRLGVAGKLIDQRLGGSHSATGAADLGAAYRLGPVYLAAAVSNLGPDMKLAGEEVPLPVTGAIGASTGFTEVGPLDLSGTLQFVRNGEGEFVPSGGLEVAWWPIVGRTFIGRIGYGRVPTGSADPLTFGGGFYGDTFSLEYAYQGFGADDRTHRIAIGWR